MNLLSPEILSSIKFYHLAVENFPSKTGTFYFELRFLSTVKTDFFAVEDREALW